MREINLDASSWTTVLDLYAALLPALGAPEWHSASIAAIADSMIGGEINEVKPPYIVKTHDSAGRPASVVEHVECAAGAIIRARADILARHDETVEACLEIVR